MSEVKTLLVSNTEIYIIRINRSPELLKNCICVTKQ
jgi:hypothetical protein